MRKIQDAKKHKVVINGHAPLLSGKALDQYISEGISDDHECTAFADAKERIEKGQWVMIRNGTAAKNLKPLMPLFDEPLNRRCMLVTDDKHPTDLLNKGHIDQIIRKAIEYGASPFVAIRMASLQAAEYFGLKWRGAIAPGYEADFLILDDLETLKIKDVYHKGRLVVKNGETLAFPEPYVDREVRKYVLNSVDIRDIQDKSFMVKPSENLCRVIRLIPFELITEEWLTRLSFEQTNGIDIERDIVKIAVLERHMGTGHIGLGFVNGTGITKGAIASSVSHDSHNIIVVGANEADMALAVNHIKMMRGGMAVVDNGKILAELPLPIAGLMNPGSAEEVAALYAELEEQAKSLGERKGINPFMNLAFASLVVIPHLKLTTMGPVDVDQQKRVLLFVEE